MSELILSGKEAAEHRVFPHHLRVNTGHGRYAPDARQTVQPVFPRFVLGALFSSAVYSPPAGSGIFAIQPDVPP